MTDELELLAVNNVKEAEAHDRLKKRYRTLLRYMAQVDKDDIVERYLDALSNSYDPHTWGPRQAENIANRFLPVLTSVLARAIPL